MIYRAAMDEAKPISLKESLRDWADWDVGEFKLAVSLGLMAPETDWAKAKHVFWSANPVG